MEKPPQRSTTRRFREVAELRLEIAMPDSPTIHLVLGSALTLLGLLYWENRRPRK